MISKEDKAKIEDFREVFRMTINPTNDDDINKVVDDLFKNVEYNYEEYKNEVPYVSVEQETYKYHILQPVDGKYSLLDFLLNRAISNVDSIWITNDNSYSTQKMISINNKRYEKERRNFSEQFIEMQYKKSRLHETGHAIHAWDEKRDNKIHSKEERVDFKKKAQLFNELLEYKYSNLLKLNTIKGVAQEAYGWHNKHSFVTFTLDEASNEYFATKYSGLYDDNKNDGLNYICKTKEKKEGIKVPNRFNGYSHGACLMYHIENLVSKKSIFQSLFFANNKAIEEFVTRYSKPIEEVLEDYKEELQIQYPELNQSRIYEKFMFIFSGACNPQPTQGRQEVQERIALQYEIMSKIFAHSYLQEYNTGRISKEKMLKILPMAYRLSPAVVDEEKKKWGDSPVRKGYKTLFKELQKENMYTSTVTPDNISNATTQTVQANPGEMAKRVQSVSKSFAESLKQNVHSNDDGEQSTRSGYRYAQVDTYNRKKHGHGR